MKIYLASGFHHRETLRTAARFLDGAGHKVVSRWIWIDERPERDGADWDNFAQEIAFRNLEDLADAEVLIIDAHGIAPDNNGGVSTELGYFLALGKPIFLLGPKRNTFQWLPWIKQTDYNLLISDLQEIPSGAGVRQAANRMGISRGNS